MIELTLSVCPPDGKRRLFLTGKIENVSGGVGGAQDYKYTFRAGSTEKCFHLPNVDTSRGAAHVVAVGLSVFESRFGGLLGSIAKASEVRG